MIQALESTVKGIPFIIILREVKRLVPDGESGAADAVCHRADTGAEETLALRVHVAVKGLAAHDDIGIISTPVRRPDGSYARAVIGYL